MLNNKIVNGIANFGERPTINGSKLLLEAHLFNFNEDIYGKHLTVEFLTFIRGEKKFDSFALLAVPLFILSGQIMHSGGLGGRLIEFSKTLVGFLPGGFFIINQWIILILTFSILKGFQNRL